MAIKNTTIGPTIDLYDSIVMHDIDDVNKAIKEGRMVFIDPHGPVTVVPIIHGTLTWNGLVMPDCKSDKENDFCLTHNCGPTDPEQCGKLSCPHCVEKTEILCPKCEKATPNHTDKCYWCDTPITIPNQNGDIFPKPAPFGTAPGAYINTARRHSWHGSWDKPHDPSDCPRCNFETQMFCGEYLKDIAQRNIEKIHGLQTELREAQEQPQLKKLVVESMDTNIELDGTNGIRIRGSSSPTLEIEAKDEDGNWKSMPHVKNIKIEVGVDNPLPIVTIEQYILKKG